MIKRLAMLTVAALVVAAFASFPTSAGEQHTAAGEVIAVDAASHQLKIQDGDRSIVFQISSSTTITRNGEPVDLGAVRAGEMATVNYEKAEGAPLAVSVELKKAA